MFAKAVTWYLVIAMFLIGIAPRVEAALSPSEALALLEFNRDADLERIQKVLEAKKVGERLEQLGLTEAEVQSRLQRLSDRQVHELATKLDDLRVAGNGSGVLIVVLLVLLFFFVWLHFTGRRVVVTE